MLVEGAKKVESKKEETTDVDTSEVGLKALQDEYRKVTGKKLVGKYTKDIPWMKKKIKEFKNK